jgi:hypothetical protein
MLFSSFIFRSLLHRQFPRAPRVTHSPSIWPSEVNDAAAREGAFTTSTGEDKSRMTLFGLAPPKEAAQASSAVAPHHEENALAEFHVIALPFIDG